MTETEVLKLLERVGAIVRDGHFVYTSGRHSDTYVNKDALYSHVYATELFCKEIARRFARDDIDVVVAPALGGIVLSQWTAYHLCEFTRRKVSAAYAEKISGAQISNSVPLALLQIAACKLLLLPMAKNAFMLKRGYDEKVRGKKVLVVEDTLTTGASARKVVKCVRDAGAKIVGVACLCNGGGITKEQLEVPKLTALLNMRVSSFEPKDCMLCARKVPINTDLGKGKELKRR